jgi:hypothetical protein
MMVHVSQPTPRATEINSQADKTTHNYDVVRQARRTKLFITPGRQLSTLSFGFYL